MAFRALRITDISSCRKQNDTVYTTYFSSLCVLSAFRIFPRVSSNYSTGACIIIVIKMCFSLLTNIYKYTMAQVQKQR